jgi:hypothetical protein
VLLRAPCLAQYRANAKGSAVGFFSLLAEGRAS